MKDHLEMLTTYSPSSTRRYCPKAEFNCTTTARIHGDTRGILRALASYAQPDNHRGEKYVPLGRIHAWIQRLTANIQRLKFADFDHNGTGSCHECAEVIATGFHERALAVAAEVLEDEQQKVQAEIMASHEAYIE